MRLLPEMAASGALRPVIDRVYPLEHAAEAHAYVDTGRKRGSVVLSVMQPAVQIPSRPTAGSRNAPAFA